MSRKRTLERHLTQLERLEAQAAADVMRAYEVARRDIVTNIMARWLGPDVIRPGAAIDVQRRLAILDEIDARMRQLGEEMGVLLGNDVYRAGEMAIEQIRREIALLPVDLRIDPRTFGAVNVAAIEQYVPLAVEDARSITGTAAGRLVREMRQGMIQGESVSALADRLLAADSAEWVRGRRDAELFARRVTVQAQNAAKEQAIAEVGDPLLQKQAVAVIGERTTDTCLRVHGQIQPIGEPFTLTGKPRFADKMMIPAFHWNCRTSIAMYHPAFERSGLTTANMRKSAKAQIARNEG